ncbi:type II and III secretion system protein family protein [Noviherbaspirillum saxi]|uniref:Type II and III secretion system protein family protein n=2 Tax=Noviherbaspirillum saxi TaxID=2320863 RepID=A0A3A3FI55_9BURK|nr:type II and III secretion system protein family protein [Noviherbaspirillum saxi]
MKAAAGSPAPAAGAKAQTQTMPGPRCTQGMAPPSEPLELKMGKSTLLRMQNPVAYRTVGSPDIVQAVLVPPDGLYLLGVSAGSTNMIIQDKSGTCHVIDVLVRMDPAALTATLRQLMPDEKDIYVTPAANSLVLSGEVDDAAAVQRAVEIADVFMRRYAPVRSVQISEAGAQPSLPETVVNQLRVRAPQQVMLEVKVAEVSKNLLEKLGVSASLQATGGSWAYTLLTNFLSGTANGLFNATKSNGNDVSLEAEKRDGLVKILAEPNLMAISGQQGEFNAGGKILIPVAQTNNAGFATITLEEKKFGVKMIFTPTVLAGGRINLKVLAGVSELSREGVGITAAGITGRSILPLINDRNASTTVQLFDGQSFAIGGLIKNNVTTNIRALPVLGEVPVLGALFRSTDFQEDRTELLFVITPRLVKPMPANYALPTDKMINPSRPELFLGGTMEGRAPEMPASAQTAMPPVQDARAQRVSGGFELK